MSTDPLTTFLTTAIDEHLTGWYLAGRGLGETDDAIQAHLLDLLTQRVHPDGVLPLAEFGYAGDAFCEWVSASIDQAFAEWRLAGLGLGATIQQVERALASLIPERIAEHEDQLLAERAWTRIDALTHDGGAACRAANPRTPPAPRHHQPPKERP